ncbi:hypothetical protein BJ508DRAFT_332873 [Ascobolus immersus RN42]|uniref:BTB domain-containing protein n=1 Tax=Ascobolus immersus RN42 TaxID=1160509 RepID=A0A3N4HLE9_ASCIM|nr:hypothetical protein BJ508DRAFT_332873 [Ascobolus immersus RN42]
MDQINSSSTMDVDGDTVDKETFPSDESRHKHQPWDYKWVEMLIKKNPSKYGGGKEPVQDLFSAGRRLWHTSKFSDFTIRAIGEDGEKDPVDFPVHKCIVCPQSGYFDAAIGQEGFREASEGIITLKEDPDLFELLLYYLYHSSERQELLVQNIGSVFEGRNLRGGIQEGYVHHYARLYILADRYIVPGLKALIKSGFIKKEYPEDGGHAELYMQIKFLHDVSEGTTFDTDESKMFRSLVLINIVNILLSRAGATSDDPPPRKRGRISNPDAWKTDTENPGVLLTEKNLWKLDDREQEWFDETFKKNAELAVELALMLSSRMQEIKIKTWDKNEKYETRPTLEEIDGPDEY